MYWILAVMGGVAAVVIALIVGGLVTPPHHEVSRSVIIAADADRVWDTVRTVERYATWRDDLRESALVDREQPQVRWRETSRRGSITFGLVQEHAPHTFTARILDDDLPFSGEWRWQLDPQSHGVRVIITESADVSNPVFRFLGAHVVGHTRSIDTYLRALARHLGNADPLIVDAAPA